MRHKNPFQHTVLKHHPTHPLLLNNEGKRDKQENRNAVHSHTLPQVFLLLALSILVSAEWTCEECQTLTGAVMGAVTSEEDIEIQVELMVAGVCPQVEDVEMCVEELPGFWRSLAPTLWTAVFDSSVWCGDCPGKVVLAKEYLVKSYVVQLNQRANCSAQRAKVGLHTHPPPTQTNF